MALGEKRRSALVLAGLALFHVVLISVQVPQGAETSVFERAVFFVTSPVQRLGAAAVSGAVSVWRGYFDLRRVRGENAALKRENFFLRQDLRFLEDRLALFRSEAEIEALLKDFRGTVLPARVIGVDSVNPYQSIVIDKGRLDGVAKDMAVCDMTGALVGRTIEPVSLKEAMVQLVTDKDSSVGVVSAAARLTGSLAGRSGPRCELRYVLASAGGGEAGEELLTTGTDRIYPAGIRVGRIVGIEPNAASPIFRRIVVEPSFRFNTLDIVAVLAAGPGDGR
ncbi:MAG TPA: rod shape-determining protein MreC [Candidatus Aminicenantes bacterium]|nr:rod shape-determining protein MreC [Candidatus Aminicenantes bacterium]